MLRLLLSALLLVQHVDSSPLRGHKNAGQDSFSDVFQYMESNPETLEELTTKQYAVLQGDVVLPMDRNAVESAWPSAEIPYVISAELADRTDDVLSAMKMVSEATCVTFHRRTSETNYLHFVRSRGCASFVGFIGGEQQVFVGPLCIVGNIVHEILHALGFHHEHTRADREQFITVLSNNIMQGREKNFQKQKGKTFGLRYDVKSIMHYGSGFFSANGLPTIVANSHVKDMGQRDEMTQTDVDKVRLLYGCDAPKKEVTEVTEVTEGSSGAERTEEDASIHDVASVLRTRVHVPDPRPVDDHSSTTSAPPAPPAPPASSST